MVIAFNLFYVFLYKELSSEQKFQTQLYTVERSFQ